MSPRPSPHRLVESPKPDPAYIALAEQSSIPSCNPATSRKLLVLDLNGTLLFRAARSHRRGHTYHGEGSAFAAPRLRTVYPRPYIPAFRAYLFAPETRAWLDTMVWSSAQPHSVEDMVSRAFADHANELVAVWDRKSLGLTQEQYHKKTMTTKDLSKPWKLLPLGLNPTQIEASTSDLSRKVTDVAMDTGTPNSIAHSALTTLLLDDSPHKAALQPHNHVCIPEYDSTRRHSDLASLASKSSDRPATKKGKKKDTQKEPQEMAVPPLRPYTSDPSVSEAPGMALADTPQSAEEPFDVTLLAVVGILDEVKHQSNVAAWIRAGGLWGSEGDAGRPGTPLDLSKKEGKKRRAKENYPGDEALGNLEISGDGAGNEGLSVGSDACTTSEPAVTATVSEESLSSIWFNDPTTVSYWVARGRKALRELGIEADHGVIA
ncbi:hypothetical protein SCLCIDRAFT_139237 [Scleroderma citrinum Foug A]|uniref:Mitochondrial import inner membrane translocase subunit TIM50 n=1 Tax=Scleroderma citrinum Foug A TaxID=1036808 RepID=A0A0C3CXK7_9AGAM|nr:hypothetical protein SCLCIDRAFT_139237 [Scleroderma citrinum Foug A]